MVICYSQPGYYYKACNNKNKKNPAEEARHMDLIMGCHIHSFSNNSITDISNLGGFPIVNQSGWTGIFSGRPEFNLPNFSAKKWQKFKQFMFHKKQKGKNFFLEKNC